eukprot:1107276-Prymnesium_polylepis.2
MLTPARISAVSGQALLHAAVATPKKRHTPRCISGAAGRPLPRRPRRRSSPLAPGRSRASAPCRSQSVMGLTFSKLFGKLFGKKDVRILM